MDRHAVLTADSIGKRFGRRTVLSAASFRARPGCITVLLGRNGSGKSTLLRIAAGWLRADYGVIFLGPQRSTRPRPARLARHGLWYLPDRSLLCRTRTVAQHFSALRRAFPSAAVDEAVAAFRIDVLLDRYPASLSTGERRRTESALTWARQPMCFLADEPLRDIGPGDRELLAERYRAMAARGTAIVMTGHEVADLLDLADDVLWLTAGTTHPLGPPPVARANFAFMRDYLGPATLRETGTTAPTSSLP